MKAILVVGLLPLLAMLGAGCSGDSEDAASGNQDLFGLDSTPHTWDHDFVVPAQQKQLSHAFKETLTRFGVTVVPSFTPTGTFKLNNSDVHVQVVYQANPPKITQMDVFSKGTWEVDGRIDLDVTAGADWKAATPDFKKSFSLGTSIGNKAFEIAKFPLFSMPLPQAPNILFQLDLELAASCELDFDAELHAFAEMGVGGDASADVFYDVTKPAGQRTGFKANSGIPTADQFHLTIPPHVAFKDGNVAQVTGKCGMQPSLNATASLVVDPTHPLADVGVKFVFQPYAEFDGTFKSMDDWSVDAKTGLKGTVSPFGDFFGQPFSTTADLNLFDFELSRGPVSQATPDPAPKQPDGSLAVPATPPPATTPAPASTDTPPSP
jgi:hypothetical protein